MKHENLPVFGSKFAQRFRDGGLHAASGGGSFRANPFSKFENQLASAPPAPVLVANDISGDGEQPRRFSRVLVPGFLPRDSENIRGEVFGYLQITDAAEDIVQNTFVVGCVERYELRFPLQQHDAAPITESS